MNIVVKEHDHEYMSGCCDARPFGEPSMDKYGVSGKCGACHENTMFNCACERCIECDEVRLDDNGILDARVEVGLKCGVCTYA